MLEWVGGQIDPETLDLDETNRAFATLKTLW